MFEKIPDCRDRYCSGELVVVRASFEGKNCAEGRNAGFRCRFLAIKRISWRMVYVLARIG